MHPPFGTISARAVHCGLAPQTDLSWRHELQITPQQAGHLADPRAAHLISRRPESAVAIEPTTVS